MYKFQVLIFLLINIMCLRSSDNKKNIFIPGVCNFSFLEALPEGYLFEEELFNYNFHGFHWSSNINPGHRLIYGKKLYQLLMYKINNEAQTSFDIYCHSHGGNLAFLNGDQNFSRNLEKFLDLCKEKNIQVNFYLIETPVLPQTEKYIEKVLNKYHMVYISHFVAANDLTQRIDIISNFPFCNRFYNFSKKYENFKQFLICAKIGHNDLYHFFDFIRLQEQQSRLEERLHYNNRSFLNSLFFNHGGKIIITTLISLISVFCILKLKDKIKKIRS